MLPMCARRYVGHTAVSFRCIFINLAAWGGRGAGRPAPSEPRNRPIRPPHLHRVIVLPKNPSLAFLEVHDLSLLVLGKRLALLFVLRRVLDRGHAVGLADRNVGV